MGGLAALLVGIGIIVVIYGLMQRAKVGRVSAPLFPTGQLAQGGAAAAGPKGTASAQGNVVCQQPLLAPVSGKPCLYYSLKVTNTWKDGDKTKEKILREEKVAAQFAVDDGSGPLFVDAKEGGDFDPEEKFLEKKKTGLLGGIVGQQLQFGHFSLDTGFGALGSEFTVEERVLPMQQRLYVNGKMSDQGVNVLTKPGFPRSLIMSSRSRDEVLGSAQSGAKYALMGGAGSAAVGVILGVVSSFIGGGEAKAEVATDTTTSQEAAAPAAQLPAAPVDTGTTEPAAIAPVAKSPQAARAPGATKPATTGTTKAPPAPSAPAAAPPPKDTAPPKDTGKTPPPAPPKSDKKKKAPPAR
jgi:hypothetical protein